MNYAYRYNSVMSLEEGDYEVTLTRHFFCLSLLPHDKKVVLHQGKKKREAMSCRRAYAGSKNIVPKIA